MARGDPVEVRFWAKVDRRGPDECWPWLGAKLGLYGVFGNKPQITASRLALQWAIGRPLTRGELACHRCDNPPCVNPAHLFVGSVADNAADMVAKGRSKRGPKSPEHQAKIRAAIHRRLADPTYVHYESRRTHCPQGHEYSPENTRTYRNKRTCIACDRARSARNHARRNGRAA